ncbi:MAG: type II toxin-antitoxin system RelE/ParE family toxin [Bacteriovoracaceae bacterium]|jgi:phage-related protein
MEIVVLRQAEKELKDAPKELMQDIYSLFDELSQGKSLGMPISRPLPSIVRGLHELRLSGKGGEFRVFYFIKIGDAIYIIHAASKKKQAIDKKTIDLLKTRVRSIE